MYRKLGRESRIRRSILAGITKDVIMNEATRYDDIDNRQSGTRLTM